MSRPLGRSYPLIDSLRGLAALCVVAVHLTLQPGLLPPEPLRAYTGHLSAAMPVFFVISGFLLYRPYAAARLHGRRPPSLRRYTFRRVLRVVPGFWLALLVIAVWLDREDVLTPSGIVTQFGFLQVYDSATTLDGIGQAWTICIEVTFYAALPLVAWALRKRLPGTPNRFLREELLFLAAVVLASTAWKFLPGHGYPRFGDLPTPAQQTLPEYADHIALGMMLAVLTVWNANREAPPRRLHAVMQRGWVAWGVAALAFLALGRFFPLRVLDNAPNYAAAHALEGAFALFVVLPAVAGGDGGLLRRALAHPVVRWLGVITFGLYLWHLAIIEWMREHDWVDTIGPAGFAAFAVASSIAVGAASWYWLEKPALRLAERLGRRPEATPPEPTPPEPLASVPSPR